MITLSAIYWPRVRAVSQRSRAIRMRDAGMTFGAISREMGIPVSTLHQWCAKATTKQEHKK